MRGLGAIISRNCKLFFKDKGMLFTSMITPAILLVLYVTFLAKIYKDLFVEVISINIAVEENLLNGLVGGQIISSLLAVCCVTVAFCSNFLMVQDKVNGAKRDFIMSPVKNSTLALGYFVSSALVTLLICFIALGICLGYLYFTGWYLTISDILLLCLDVLLLVLFGTSLSSIINCNLSTSGQESAVGTIVSAGYGFICGAYMPISNFGEWLQKILSLFPGIYGTALIRNHSLNGVYKELTRIGFPEAVIDNIKNSIDCNRYFFGKQVSLEGMYGVMVISIIVLVIGYLLFNLTEKNN